MGADYTAMALIGIKVDPSRLYTTKTVKAFEHDHPESMKYDPQSGSLLWMQVQEPIEIMDADQKGLAGYPLLWGTNDAEAFVAIVYADDTDSNAGNTSAFDVLPPDIGKEKEKLKKALEPHGLWDEKAFGLYTVLHCSY